MIRICFLLILSAGFGQLIAAPEVRLAAGLVIRQSVTISRDQYHLNADANNTKALIVIEGQNIIVDFNNSVLQGSNDQGRPDAFYGLALIIKKGAKNITIKNAFVHGYKIAIMAEGVDNLSIINCDLSYNWRQQLFSDRGHEDERDRMDLHHNERDEWLQYGAAIYLKNCSKAVISNNIVTGGQCGLMMTRCGGAEIFDNNISFNSGIGIGLYRSSNNKVYHNRLDWNVRGYNQGQYQWEQDSAGILVFEQSNNNLFAYNSATHSGNGFFLWASQSTTDKGKVGCNDNIIFGNDFSYAPADGIEVTFSSNVIMQNTIYGCEHGVWGAYSFDSDITGNLFGSNSVAIAIEHGNGINIAVNEFAGDKTGIRLWSHDEQSAGLPPLRLRNTDSKNYWVAANRFNAVDTVYDIMGTDSITLSGNVKKGFAVAYKAGPRVSEIDTTTENEQLELEYVPDEKLKTIKASQLPSFLYNRGKEHIKMTEWGPYDFRYPLARLKDIDSSGLYHFEIIGPVNGQAATWQLMDMTGFEVIAQGDNIFPSSIIVKATGNDRRSISLRYSGPSYTDQFGKKSNVTQPQAFGYSEPNNVIYREVKP